ncbi:MAG: choice-of-anchor X domain-containing protein, partial [Fervidicoccaceae archaeon]
IEFDKGRREFTVDSYRIEARAVGRRIEGNVSYYFIAPKEIRYTFLPSKASGVVNVVNGSFSIELPDDQTGVILECGSTRTTVERGCLSYGEALGLKLEANVTCLEVEEREGGILVRLKSQERFTAMLKVHPVDQGLLPLSEDGKRIYVRTRIFGRVQEFLLQDGSPSDPDGVANGEFTLLLSRNISQEETEARKIPGLNKTALSQAKKPKLKEVKEFLANSAKEKWRIKIYELSEGSAAQLPFDLIPLKRKNAFLREEKLGEAEVGISYKKLKEGRILVEVSEKKGEWIRVDVELPRGSVAEQVLALDENGTRELDLWYQRGNRLVFYDDPNRYYYVLYKVPAWWDPDGVCNGYDWHYRIPIQVPPLARDHTIYLDVNFTKLLRLMNITGSFDPNSVRIVDDSGILVPKQEFVQLGSGFGRVKFILHKNLSSPTMFYIYFDIVENGAKPYFNTLNAGLDSGTLNYWAYGRNPPGISSIIQASPRGPYTVYDPDGSPNYVTDDGAPVFGEYSLVLGYRTSSGREDSTSAGEDTWAYYEFTVPSDGGTLYFWYRVESWDSTNYDYFRAELRDTSNNVLATIVNNYNPNPGSNYGYFNDSGWLSASFDLSPYAGQTVRTYFLVHTFSDSLYKTWAYIDNLTWAPVDLTSSVINSMVEGFGVNVTSPKGMLDYGPLRVEAKVDAKPSNVIARIYNPSGSLIATAQLYDDGTHGDAVANDGIYTNANAYSLTPGSPLGKWRVIVLANDSSTSTYSPAHNGLIHIPSRPYEVNYTDFFNVDESFFYLGSLRGEIFEDKDPIGLHGGEDNFFNGVYIYAFRDDGDGIFDPLNDTLVTWASSADGAYQLSVLPGGYFLTLNSRTLSPPEGLNAGHTADETWAEQTYQTEWNGSAYVGRERLGGGDPKISDSCTLELVFHDDFETWSGWNTYRQGGVRQSSAESYNGTYSLEKYTGQDPNGGYKLLGRTIGRGYLLQGYAYRPTPIGPRSRVSVGLVDASYNGYGFIVDHRNNLIRIVRRAGGIASTLAQQSYNPPENSWYFWKLILLTNNTIIFRLYNTDGDLLAQVRATDPTYNSFDRILVQGDYTYYLDSLVLWRLPDRCEHIMKVDTSKYLGESLDFGFSYEVVVNTKDSDDAPSEPRFAQGSLRQFIMNSNAITGMQASYFRIPKTDSGYAQETVSSGNIDVWRIELSSDLPQITDIVNLTARTQSGAYSYIAGSYVGCDYHRIP